MGLLGCSSRYVPKQPALQSTAAGRIRPLLIERSRDAGDELTLEAEMAYAARLDGAYSAHEPPIRRVDRDGERLGRIDLSTATSIWNERCAGQTVDRFAMDGETEHRGAQSDARGWRRITLNAPSFSRYLLLDVEHGGQRQCVPVLVDWSRAWKRDDLWELVFYFGADFNVAGEGFAGVGGARLDAFRWFGNSRLGLEIGLLNGELCREQPCEPGAGAYTIPIGVEADAFFFSGGGDGRSPGAAFVGGGLRFIAYTPADPSGTFTLSPQAALRLVASLPPNGPDPKPAGLVLDHGVYAGPAFSAESGGVAMLAGFSLGIGWAR